MKEFSTTIDDAFSNGLKPREDIKRNQPFLTDAVNLRVSEGYGLLSIEEVNIPSIDFSGNGIDISYPFPQLFIGKSVTLLADEATIYEVDRSDWSLTELTTYDPYNESSTLSITGDGKWHFLDLGDAWFLFNGTTTVYRTAKDSIFGNVDKAFALKTMTINTGTYLNGRSIMGGFSEGDFWHSDYTTFWQSFLDDINETPEVALDMPIKSNFVSWSSIGGGDVLFWILPDLAKTGLLDSEYSNTKSLLMDYLRRNELGFMPMPWDGEVLNIEPLGKGVIVYGSNGISYMPQVKRPIPTFGMRDLLDVGIMGRNAVAGDKSLHTFIDEDGYLWRVNSQLETEKIDYRSYLKDLTNPSIFYNDQLTEFYITDSDEEYIMTERGLSKGGEYLTTYSKNYGIHPESGPSKCSFITNIIDFKLRSIKQITVIEFGITGTAGFDCRVHYRFKTEDDFSQTDWKPVNNEGAVYMMASGLEFKVELKGDDYNNVEKIDYARLRYKVSDKRSIRGSYQ